MITIMPGDRVRLKSELNSPINEMNDYKGKVVTVREVRYTANFDTVECTDHKSGNGEYHFLFSMCDIEENISTSVAGLGLKYDTGKPLFSCLTRGCAKALAAVVAVLTYGALKYKRDSWQTVPDAEVRYEDALDRHLNRWKQGHLYDAETGLSELAHVACNVMFLLELEIKRVEQGKTNVTS